MLALLWWSLWWVDGVTVTIWLSNRTELRVVVCFAKNFLFYYLFSKKQFDLTLSLKNLNPYYFLQYVFTSRAVSRARTQAFEWIMLKILFFRWGRLGGVIALISIKRSRSIRSLHPVVCAVLFRLVIFKIIFQTLPGYTFGVISRLEYSVE